MSILAKYTHFGSLTLKLITELFFVGQNKPSVSYQKFSKQCKEIPTFKKKNNSIFGSHILLKSLTFLDSVLK